MITQAYRARKPKTSPLWQCLFKHFDAFLDVYEERYRSRYGYLRPIIPEVVKKFLDCGNLERGFARVRCDHCQHEFILAFSCKGRWFCPSCHQKKVQLFGELLSETILYPVPHRHFTLTIPKMLRPYFRFDRDLLKVLCRIANQCLVEFMRTALGLPEGIAGIVMVIHTFGEYLDFHPHLHALVADGLFTRSGVFHVLPDVSLRPLEELFRARVIAFLLEKGLLPPKRARMLRDWKHSGFNIHRSRRVGPDEDEDRERLAQYIIRSPFSLKKMRVTDPGGSIVYRSEINPKIKRNFEVFSPTDFIRLRSSSFGGQVAAVITRGWLARRSLGEVGYSNKMRGQREKRAAEREEVADEESVEVIDVSGHQPRRIPSKKWRELIKKVWEADPLLCPNCGEEMRIVGLINERDVIERILRHLGLWEPPVRVVPARDPPGEELIPAGSDPWIACPPELQRRRDEDPFLDYEQEPAIMAS